MESLSLVPSEVSVWGLCPGGSLQGVSLSQGSLSGRPPQDRDLTYDDERAVRILLECFLVGPPWSSLQSETL